MIPVSNNTRNPTRVRYRDPHFGRQENTITILSASSRQRLRSPASEDTARCKRAAFDIMSNAWEVRGKMPRRARKMRAPLVIVRDTADATPKPEPSPSARRVDHSTALSSAHQNEIDCGIISRGAGSNETRCDTSPVSSSP